MAAVTYEQRGAVALVTVDDGRANALNHELLAELGAALDRAESDAGAVVVTGRPGRFCAGFDLAAMRAGEEARTALVRSGLETALRVFAFPRPVVLACTGHALAAGALLLLVGDVRIGADGAFRIGLNEVAIGLPISVCGLELARYRLPPSKLDAVMLGTTFAPPDAVAAGYLDRVVDADALLDEAVAAADSVAGLDAAAFTSVREGVRGPTAARVRELISEVFGR